MNITSTKSEKATRPSNTTFLAVAVFQSLGRGRLLHRQCRPNLCPPPLVRPNKDAGSGYPRPIQLRFSRPRCYRFFLSLGHKLIITPSHGSTASISKNFKNSLAPVLARKLFSKLSQILAPVKFFWASGAKIGGSYLANPKSPCKRAENFQRTWPLRNSRKPESEGCGRYFRPDSSIAGKTGQFQTARQTPNRFRRPDANYRQTRPEPTGRRLRDMDKKLLARIPDQKTFTAEGQR